MTVYENVGTDVAFRPTRKAVEMTDIAGRSRAMFVIRIEVVTYG